MKLHEGGMVLLRAFCPVCVPVPPRHERGEIGVVTVSTAASAAARNVETGGDGQKTGQPAGVWFAHDRRAVRANGRGGFYPKLSGWSGEILVHPWWPSYRPDETLVGWCPRCRRWLTVSSEDVMTEALAAATSQPRSVVIPLAT